MGAWYTEDDEHMDNGFLKKIYEGVSHSRTFLHLLDAYNLRNKRVLDLGCGHGQYLRCFGPGSVGITTARDEVVSGTEQGLDIRFGNAEHLGEVSSNEIFDVVWANNLFEHLRSPHAFLMHLKKNVAQDGMLILGVPVFPFPSALLHFKKFRGVLASNHINFFTRKTLILTVERAGWKVLEARGFFFRNRGVDSFCAGSVPHVYIIAKNDSAFVYSHKKIHEWEEDKHYRDLLEITGQQGRL